MIVPLFFTLAVAGAASSESPASVRGIEWRSSYEETLELAAAEGQLIFVSLLADGEGRTERLRKEGLRDKDVGKATEGFLCLGASSGAFSGDKAAAKTWGLSVDEHRRLYANLVEEVAAANDEGYIALPQHLWLDSEGEVLLCAPYELNAEELLWCFAEASAAADPDTTFTPPEGLAPPGASCTAKPGVPSMATSSGAASCPTSSRRS